MTAIVAAASALLGLASQATALSPPPVDKAEIVYSNGGRLVSIKSDGSGRRVLTRHGSQLLSRNFLADVHHFGDNLPAVSPDGTKLAFVRYIPGKHQSVMIAGRDGNGVHRLPVGIDGEIETVDWTPQRRLLVTVLNYRQTGRRDFAAFRVMTMNTDGVARKLLLFKRYSDGCCVIHEIRAQEISSDGRWLLYVHDPGGGDEGSPQLRSVDLVTDRDSLLVEGGEAGAFSPDGERIAYTVLCDDDPFFSECSRGGSRSGIWSVDADGSNRRVLVDGDGEYSSPDWSPDGGHIVFASNRNFPIESQDANEIYSVRSDGECLTWLTNGSPESISPTWGPEATVSSDAGPKCGDADREPLLEVRPSRPLKTDACPRYWAGPLVAGRLLSRLDGYAQEEFGSETYRYGDCPYFEATDCRRPITLELAKACSPIGEVRVPPRGKRESTTRRGVPVLRHLTARGMLVGTTLRVGKVKVGVGQSMLDVEGTTGRASTFADHLAFIDRLRPVGRALVPGSKLPGPAKAHCGKMGVR